MTKTLSTVLALIILTAITSIFGTIVISLTPFTLDLGTIVLVALTSSAIALIRSYARERRETEKVTKLVEERIAVACPALIEAASQRTLRRIARPRLG